MCLSIKVSRPNDVLAEGEHLGFEWAVVHNGNGYRCGYIRLPAGHPWHGAGYYDSIVEGVEVHGGLTFAEADKPCHKTGPDDAWWLGFDCAHFHDRQDPFLPREIAAFDFPGAEVRSQEYVEDQCRSLCKQAAAA